VENEDNGLQITDSPFSSIHTTPMSLGSVKIEDKLSKEMVSVSYQSWTRRVYLKVEPTYRELDKGIYTIRLELYKRYDSRARRSVQILCALPSPAPRIRGPTPFEAIASIRTGRLPRPPNICKCSNNDFPHVAHDMTVRTTACYRVLSVVRKIAVHLRRCSLSKRSNMSDVPVSCQGVSRSLPCCLSRSTSDSDDSVELSSHASRTAKMGLGRD
jgi:hypothetical protein